MESLLRDKASAARNLRFRRCPDGIRFRLTDPKHEPVQVQEHHFHTVGIDYVKGLNPGVISRVG